MDRPHTCSGSFEEEKNLLPPPGKTNFLGCPAHRLDTTMTMLSLLQPYRLLYNLVIYKTVK
jgi:hypothetical protein